MERKSERCRREQIDCNRAGWTAGRKSREFETVFFGHPGFDEREIGTALDLGWRLQCELLQTDDSLSPRGRVIPRPRKLADTNDILRPRALHGVVAELDLTGTDACSEQELYTRCSWTELGDAQTQMDLNMVLKKLEARRLQVLDFDWLKTDHRAVLDVLSLKIETETLWEIWSECVRLETKRFVAKSGHRNADGLENWDVLAPFLFGNCKGAQIDGDQRYDLLQKKREGRHLGQAELNRLCRAIWRKRRALKREKHLIKIQESAETPEEDTKQAFQLARESRNRSHKFLSRHPLNSCGPIGP